VSSRKQLKPVDEVGEEECQHTVKKHRTPPDLPEEARIAAHIPPEEVEVVPVDHPKRSTAPEVDPDGDQWDDLDAEDTDDPLMVSEYVSKIFAHLKQVEAGESSTVPFLSLIPSHAENDHA
jgi:hypothetical protein